VAGAEIMSRRAKKSAGFTLMEVVVAITLMSLIMLTLVMGLRVTANAWHRGEQKMDEHARVMAGADVMSEQVSQAAIRIVAQIDSENKVTRIVAFYGSPSELRFCTSRSWKGERNRPQYMADYTVTRNGEGKRQLVLNQTGLTDDDSVLRALRTPRPDSGQAVGLPADEIELAYYQPATLAQPGQWVGDWQPRDGAELPRAVRVNWVRAGESQQMIFPVGVDHRELGR
jgi:general secretion pathway protein J